MIMKLKPIFKEKLWGGKKLKTFFDLPIPSNHTGEVWGISGLKEDSNEILNTPYKGMTLYNLWQNHRHLFGGKTGTYFPILIKLIDAAKDLSIQVHPDDTKAKQHGSLGKTECWKILDCDKDTEIIIGHKARNIAEIKNAIAEKRVLDIVNHHRIKPGDFFFIKPGTLHAIKAGTLLLEVQQSSDITYRFYDYDRQEKGKPRPLHIEEALSVVKVPDCTLKTSLDKRYFDINFIKTGSRQTLKSHAYGDFITVLDGTATIDKLPVKKGMFLFVPAGEDYHIEGALSLAIATII